MTLREVFESRSEEWINTTSRTICEDIQLDWNLVSCIVRVCTRNPEYVPGYRMSRNDSDPDKIRKWLNRFNQSFLNRPSRKIGAQMTTISDPLIDVIFEAYGYQNTDEIRTNHRNSMMAENILGSLLEEYLHQNVIGTGWRVAWGESVKSVDVVKCNTDGTFVLLQVKNKYNSENSSSQAVREGTIIEKWHRLKADGTTRWPELCQLFGLQQNQMTEQRYRDWVTVQIRNNPAMISFE